MTNKIDNKKTVAVQADGLITGMRKRFTNGSSTITVGNETITVDAAVANLQAIVDNRAAVTTARAAARVTVANENAKMPPLLAFMTALVAFVRGVCGNDATALADFDLEPRKTRKPMTAAEKAVAAAKRQATREARGEVSADKRKALTGNVTAKLVVTPASPEAPTAPAAPEPPAEPAAQTTPTKA
ncbi:MAG TPA: hypothetical protein VF765_19620 [Polyangiaceae bacterium]